MRTSGRRLRFWLFLIGLAAFAAGCRAAPRDGLEGDATVGRAAPAVAVATRTPASPATTEGLPRSPERDDRAASSQETEETRRASTALAAPTAQSERATPARDGPDGTKDRSLGALAREPMGMAPVRPGAVLDAGGGRLWTTSVLPACYARPPPDDMWQDQQRLSLDLLPLLSGDWRPLPVREMRIPNMAPIDASDLLGGSGSAVDFAVRGLSAGGLVPGEVIPIERYAEALARRNEEIMRRAAEVMRAIERARYTMERVEKK